MPAVRSSRREVLCHDDLAMNPDPSPTPEHERSAVRPVCAVLALLCGVIGGMIVSSSLSSTEGWSVLLMALYFGQLAYSYSPDKATTFQVSRPRLIVILGVCVIPPLVLLFLFGDRAGWRQPLLIFFLLSITIGPVVLLWRYRRRSKRLPE